MRKLGMAVVLAISAGAALAAEDWPEIRGKGRLGVWTETGIVERFPADGLKILWRTPVKAGFAGPSVARRTRLRRWITRRRSGRAASNARWRSTRRPGKILWTQEWEVDYRGMSYGLGPRATPTVDGDRVYFAGADGKLFCLNADTGAVVWKKDFVADYGADRAKWGWDWGFSSSPLVDGPRLIALVGGRPDAKVVAFDKLTGKELWRALSSESELGVAQPIIISAGGTRQLIIWYPGAVASLDPVTGKVYWEQPYKVGASMTVATPIHTGSLLFFTNFYDGPLMLALDEQKPARRCCGRARATTRSRPTVSMRPTATPVIIGDYIYGICSYGQFRCLRGQDRRADLGDRRR